jgi:hypothetical protein
MPSGNNNSRTPAAASTMVVVTAAAASGRQGAPYLQDRLELIANLDCSSKDEEDMYDPLQQFYFAVGSRQR